MRRMIVGVPLVWLGLALLPAAGCGGGESGTVTQSPEAKKADEGGQKAMEDFMRGKGAPKK